MKRAPGTTAKPHSQSGRCGNCRQYNKISIYTAATSATDRNRPRYRLNFVPCFTPPPPGIKQKFSALCCTAIPRSLCYVHNRQPCALKAIESHRTVQYSYNATQVTYLAILITFLYRTFPNPYSKTPFSPRLIQPSSAGSKMVGRHRCDGTNRKQGGVEAPPLMKSYVHLNLLHASPAVAVALNPSHHSDIGHFGA